MTNENKHAKYCPSQHIERSECGICCPPTPGPWSASGHTVYASDGETVIGAAFRRGDEEFEGIDDRAARGTEGNGPATANARLIAAAPELLAALKPMQNPPIGPKIMWGWKAGTFPVFLNQAQIDAMRAAIAKARGVS